MALQIRRGTNATRTTITPSEGELLYTTDTKNLYIGDGTTLGGNIITGGGGGLANLVDDTTPQLGGNLDVNGYSIVSVSTNQDIGIYPNGDGRVILHGGFKVNPSGNIEKTGELNISPTSITSIGNNTTLVDGNLYITRNSHSSSFGQGFTFAQHHNTADSVNVSFYRTRGTGLSPLAVQNGDDLIDITFFGWDGSARVGGAAISAIVEGSPTPGHIPTKLSFITNNGSSNAIRAELSSSGIWKVNTVQNYSGTTLNLTSPTVSVNGNLTVSGTISGAVTSSLLYSFVTHNSSVSILSTGAGVVVDGTNNVNTVFRCYRGMTYKWTNNTAVTVQFLDSANTAIASAFLITSTGAIYNEAGPGETVTWTIPLNATPGATNYKYRVKTDIGVGNWIEIL